MADTYHHENLRQELIDEGIRLINEIGEEALSLRKVAAACGVSHAAPYAHFKDKEELLEAIKSDVTERFMNELEASVRSEAGKSADRAVIAMGRAYVSFFRRNPDYFRFLFGKQNIVAHLNMNEVHDEDYPPFKLLCTVYKKAMSDMGVKQDAEELEICILRAWALVHGFAAISCMSGVETSIDWENLDDRFIN